MRHKLEGGPPPARTGPVFTFLGRGLKLMGARKDHCRPPVPLSPVSSDDGRSRSTTITWVDEKVNESPAAVVLQVCGKASQTAATFAPHGKCCSRPEVTPTRQTLTRPREIRHPTSGFNSILDLDLLDRQSLARTRRTPRAFLRRLSRARPTQLSGASELDGHAGRLTLEKVRSRVIAFTSAGPYEPNRRSSRYKLCIILLCR